MAINGKIKKDVKEARLQLAGLCARQEVCEAEVREKCVRWQLHPQETEEIIRFLKGNSFIDDCRYAMAFAHDKCIYNGWGRNKIRMHLIHKHIDERTISDALGNIPATEYEEVLRRCARAKASTLDLGERSGRDKLLRHLLSRGFTYDEIKKSLSPR